MTVKIVTLARNTLREFTEDDCSTHAQAMSYSALFSIFPLLLAATAALGFVIADSATLDKIMSSVYENLPGSAAFIGNTLQNVEVQRGTATAISVVLLIISGRGVFVALVHALDIAFEAPRARSFIPNLLLAFELLFGVGLLALLSVGVTAAIQVLASVPIIGYGPYADSVLLTPIQFAISFAISLAMFALLYRWAPNIRVSWKDILPGAVVAALLFEVAKLLFVYYVRLFMGADSVYGAIGSVIVLLTWCYFASMILLLGAEVSSEYAKLRLAERAPKSFLAEMAPRPGPVMVAPAKVPVLTERLVALGAAAVASVAAFLAILGTGRSSRQA
jgi:membrane protein